MADNFSLAYRTIDAQHFGVAQRRRRCYLVVDFAGECAGEILFEREGVSRDFAPRFPDLYVGYTTDFNRATAQTAMEVTEKQVFQPERKSLAWTINNKLLNEYQFKYVEAYFKEPDISNPDDLAKILNIAERAGGITPNKAKDIAFSIMGDSFEPFVGEWADVPLAYSKTQGAAHTPIDEQIQAQIQKAASGHDDAIVAVMKEVRALVAKMSAGR
ncbi:hypothetical protein FACS1894217_03850 [Clostridia bacterium]|nr:hypothetical protein FACS1894217_03850 [Clostridia bacterium]